MTKNKSIDRDIIEKMIQEYGEGVPAAQLCRTYGMPRSSFYFWLSKAAASGSTQKDRMLALKAENTRLKIILAESVLEMILEQANISQDKQWRQKLNALLSIDEIDT